VNRSASLFNSLLDPYDKNKVIKKKKYNNKENIISLIHTFLKQSFCSCIITVPDKKNFYLPISYYQVILLFVSDRKENF
jgi:hypothetical protein